MLTKILIILINALIITIVIELSLALILKVRVKKDIINIILVNIVTNPIVVLFPYLVGLRHDITYRYILLAILEIFAFLFEGYIYKKYLKYNKINPYILSLILNIASYTLGNIINNIIY